MFLVTKIMPSNPLHFCAILVQSFKTQKKPANTNCYLFERKQLCKKEILNKKDLRFVFSMSEYLSVIIRSKENQ